MPARPGAGRTERGRAGQPRVSKRGARSGAAACAIGGTTDAPLAAVGGAVLVMIVCAILDAIPALGDLRQGLPGHYAFAWADALAANVDYSEMITGALWSVGYSILLVGFAFWHFLRKDITS